MSRNSFRLAAAVIVAALVAPVSAAAQPAPALASCAEPGPGQDFAERPPAELGFDPAMTAALDAVRAARPANIAINVYRNGCRVYSTGPQTDSVTAQSFSVAKSVSAMGVARAMQLGKLSLDSTVGQFVPEADPAHAAVTVRDLLTMTGGADYDFVRDYGAVDVDNLADWLSRPIVHRPGSYYQYDQSPPAVLDRLTARAVGSSFRDFVRTQLFEPLGVGDDQWSWLPSSDGDVAGYWNLLTTPPVYGKLGELMRLDGVWNGQRLLSRDFMAEVAAGSAANPHYGLMFWTNSGDWGISPMTMQNRTTIQAPMIPGAPRTLYGMWGILGQRVMIEPETGIVIQTSGLDPIGQRAPSDALLNLFDGDRRLDWELTQAVFTHTIDPQPLAPQPFPGELPHDWQPDEGLLHTLRHPEQILGITDQTRRLLEFLEGYH